MALRIVVLAALLVSMVALVTVIARTKMVSGKFLLIICALLAVLLAVTAVLLFVFGRRRLPWAGIVVALLLSVVMIFGSVAGMRGINTLRSITSPSFSTSHIGIYVRADDPAQALEDMTDYSFGILEELGREHVDKAIEQINERLPAPIRTVSFNGPGELVSALTSGAVNAALMNASYIDGLRETEDYVERVAQMREITNLEVQIQVTPRPAGDTVSEHVLTVLISGIDSRNGLVDNSLSDVNILVTVNTQTHQVLLVTVPRDYFVPFSNTGVRDKLTHAGWYGIGVLMDTIGNFFGIDIDYYFRLNFDGFVNIIDALGGVTVVSDYEFTSSHEKYHYVKGENNLDGEHALEFVRERKAFSTGDRQRGKHQMAVIQAVAKKVLSPELLTNYADLLNALQGSFKTSVPYDLIASLVREQLNNWSDWNITSYSVDGSDEMTVSPALGVEAYVTEPDLATVEYAKNLMAQIRNGQIPETTPSAN